MKSICKIVSIIGLSLGLVGCAEEANRGRVMTGSTLCLNTVCPDVAFAAAQKIIEQTYRIDSLDCTRHQLITYPLEYTAKDNSGAVGDLLVPSNRTFRNVVSLRVAPEGATGSFISVRVDVQRRDTVPARAFASLREGDDRPANTSAFQATGYSNNNDKRDVWTSLRRDYTEEQTLLTAIKSCLLKSPTQNKEK